MSIQITANMRIPVPFGSLATDVYRPESHGRSPVVVTRTAYGKNNHLDEGIAWATRGFAFVVQDIRGRYESDGVWSPYQNERDDGAALLDWLARQAWVGNIVLLGGSYNAFAAWSAAVARPEATAAVISLAPAMGFDAVKFDPAGILRLDEHVHWWIDRADSRVDRPGLAAAVVANDPTIMSHLPVVEISERLCVDAPGWRRVVDAGPTPGPEPITAAELADVDVHSLHVCGWFDLVAADTIQLWQQLVGTGTARHHDVVLGPWDHDLTLSQVDNSTDVFPPQPFDLGGTLAKWIRDLDTTPPSARAHVLPVGTNLWIRDTQWPPRNGYTSRVEVFHLSKEGFLGPTPDAEQFEVSFVDEPAAPVPSVVAGWDRRGLEYRSDVASFTSDPLAESVLIAGSPVLQLWARSSNTHSDWIARLVVLLPCGSCVELATGTHVASELRAEGIILEMGPIAAHLSEGSRIRLEIAGTDFPRLARNLGTGHDRYNTAQVAASRRAVRTGTLGGTALHLPVIVTGER